jgi:hypothetical protein
MRQALLPAHTKFPPHTKIVDVFARRGTKLTFVSLDRADDDPIGWFNGHGEDGEFWKPGCVAYRLTHVAEGSWRCRAPVAAQRVRAVA